MATICERIINKDVTVVKSIIHVSNFGNLKGAPNVEHAWLTFSDGSHIGYALDMYLDLPDGDYEMINYEYVKIEEEEEEMSEEVKDLVNNLKLEIEISKLTDYLEYLVENAKKFSAKESLDKLYILTKNLTAQTYEVIMNEAERIALIINNKADEFYGKSKSENVQTMIKYVYYLKQRTNLIMERLPEIITDENFEKMVTKTNDFAEKLEKLEKFINPVWGRRLMKAIVINTNNYFSLHPEKLGHSQSTASLTLYKTYDVEIIYNGLLYNLIDDNGCDAVVDKSRFMLLSEWRDIQIEEILK